MLRSEDKDMGRAHRLGLLLSLLMGPALAHAQHGGAVQLLPPTGAHRLPSSNLPTKVRLQSESAAKIPTRTRWWAPQATTAHSVKRPRIQLGHPTRLGQPRGRTMRAQSEDRPTRLAKVITDPLLGIPTPSIRKVSFDASQASPPPAAEPQSFQVPPPAAELQSFQGPPPAAELPSFPGPPPSAEPQSFEGMAQGLTPAPMPLELQELYNRGVVIAELGPGDDDFWSSTSFQSPELLGTLSSPGSETSGGRRRFQSDHAFDFLSSPVTNPFLAEDPRSLTEVRPYFIYQSIPNDLFPFNGGDLEAFGAQGRLAITERWSIVMHKLGGVAIQPGSSSFLGDEIGFAELHLGPKFVFWRDVNKRFLASSGLIFQIPIGSSSVYQNTGDLSLVPYVSLGKNFWPNGWGSFNLINVAGVSIATDNQRSDFFYNSFHLDFNVHNCNRYFPFVELNWFQYLSNGEARPEFNFEGQDIANLGGRANGTGFLSIATGTRYRFGERFDFGIGVEFPLLSDPSLNDFRLTTDLIWRY